MYKPLSPARSPLATAAILDGAALATASGGAPPVARTPTGGSGTPSFHTAQSHPSSRPGTPPPAQPPAQGPTAMQRLHDAGITNGRVGAFIAGLSLAGGLAVGIPALTKDDEK